MSNKIITLEIDEKRLHNLRRYAAEIDAEGENMMGCSCCQTDLASLFYHGVKGTKDQSLEEVMMSAHIYHEESILDYTVKGSELILTLHEDYDEDNYNDFIETIDQEVSNDDQQTS